MLKVELNFGGGALEWNSTWVSQSDPGVACSALTAPETRPCLSLYYIIITILNQAMVDPRDGFPEWHTFFAVGTHLCCSSVSFGAL